MIPREWLPVVGLSLLALMAACTGGRTEATISPADTIPLAAPADTDSLYTHEDEVEELRLPEGRDEAFSDFIFTFVFNRRFQAERIRFPLAISEEGDSIPRRIRSGAAFRSEFDWPGDETYTMLLTDAGQMEAYQNDLDLAAVEVQLIDLSAQRVKGYNFRRTSGRWHLEEGRYYRPEGRLGEFLRFYNRFVSDSIFQQQCLASNIRYVTPDEEDGSGSIEGTLEPAQWPIFRPELPQGTLTNIRFGQDFDGSSRLVLVQCGLSNGLMDFYTFQREGGGWRLTSFEN